MKARILLLFLLLFLFLIFAASAQQAAGPEPAPWWQRVEDTQALFFKWLGFLTLAGGALTTWAVGLYVKLKVEVREAKERLNRQTSDRQQIQAQVTDIAKQITPPAPLVVAPDAKP